MAGSSLFALIDDIATLLDDVALMTKMAAKKTAGVLGDDLALNAQQVTGVRANRELPVVWAVAKGSFINKLILVPAALLISAFAGWLITPLMIVGGTFLCFEGIEKLAHKESAEEGKKAALHDALDDPSVDMAAFERDKVKGAIRTDFILSAEIIVITLGTVAAAAFSKQVMVLSVIAIAMTIGVYGLVAGIVKIDDAGIWLSRRTGDSLFARFQRALGYGLIQMAPWLMKFLSIAGLIAMFLVGGGIVVHGIPWLHHAVEGFAAKFESLAGFIPMLANGIVGVLIGILAFIVVSGVKKIFSARNTVKQ